MHNWRPPKCQERSLCKIGILACGFVLCFAGVHSQTTWYSIPEVTDSNNKLCRDLGCIQLKCLGNSMIFFRCWEWMNSFFIRIQSSMWPAIFQSFILTLYPEGTSFPLIALMKLKLSLNPFFSRRRNHLYFFPHPFQTLTSIASFERQYHNKKARRPYSFLWETIPKQEERRPTEGLERWGLRQKASRLKARTANGNRPLYTLRLLRLKSHCMVTGRKMAPYSCRARSKRSSSFRIYSEKTNYRTLEKQESGMASVGFTAVASVGFAECCYRDQSGDVGHGGRERSGRDINCVFYDSYCRCESSVSWEKWLLFFFLVSLLHKGGRAFCHSLAAAIVKMQERWRKDWIKVFKCSGLQK